MTPHSPSPGVPGFPWTLAVGRRRRTGWAIVGLFLAVLFAGMPLRAAGTNFFSEGVELSGAGKFPEAADAFEAAERAQPAAGTLLNLGLVEWQRGHAGAAILAWEKVLWINPFDHRAESNLAFARQVAQVEAPQLKWYESVSTWLPAEAWLWLAGVTLWLTVGLLVLPAIFRRRRSGWQQTLAALAFGFFLFTLTGNVGVVSRSHMGFVIHKNARLQLTPTHDGEVISPLASGEPARAIRRRGSFVFVRTLSNSGWIDAQDFGLVCSP